MEIFKDKNGLTVTQNPDSDNFFNIFEGATPSAWRHDIRFQDGSIKEVGMNGVTNEVLLEIVKHRLANMTGAPAAKARQGIEHALTQLRTAI